MLRRPTHDGSLFATGLVATYQTSSALTAASKKASRSIASFGLGNFLQLVRVAEESRALAVNCSHLLEQAEGDAHLGPAGANQQRKLTLRHAKVKRHLLAGRGLRLQLQRREQQSGNPDLYAV